MVRLKERPNRYFTSVPARMKLKKSRAKRGMPEMSRPGSVCQPNPDRYRNNTGELAFPRAPFRAVCVGIMQEAGLEYRCSDGAFYAIQSATEGFVQGLFADANLCSRHAGRQTVTVPDLRLAAKLNTGCRVYKKKCLD
jgi:histone H3